MSEVLRQTARRRAEATERIALGITAGFGLAVSGSIIALLIHLLLFLVAIAGVKPAVAQSTASAPGVMLQSGIEKEDVDGDLKAAMTIYEEIATDTTAPREVRAKALLRLAGCEEKLGKQAKQVYEQIVRDYADQPAAAQARSRLAAIRMQEHPAPPETMSVRKIDWEKLGYFGAEDTDGHRAAYLAPDGNLYVGDISGHAKTLAYSLSDQGFPTAGWEVSRDFSIAALMLPKTKTRPVTLAVVKTDGTGYRELLHDDEQGNILGGNSEFEVRWSWDDRSLLVNPTSCAPSSKSAQSRLWIVSVADDKRRELVHEESALCIVRAALSPDGQFVAHEVWPLPPYPQGTTSKVFVVPIQGGEPRLVYESEPWLDSTAPFQALADWTADGRYLAVKGIHEGRHALFLLPMKNGVAAGAPVFVRVGDFEDAWSTLSGALIFEDKDLPSPVPHFALHLASIGLDGNIGKWVPIELNRRPLPAYPSLSSDGSQIAYVARSLHSTETDLIVRDVATGRERVVYQSDADPFRCEYSAIRPIVFCTSEHGGEKTDLLSVSVDSGAAEQIATFSDARSLIHRPQDGKVFYFRRGKNKNGYTDPKLRWDRTTQKETVVADAAEVEDYLWTLSLDGRWVMRQRNGVLSFRPMSGGAWKTLASGIENYYMPGSTPDGNWAVYIGSAPRPEILEASFSGGEPRRAGDLPTKFSFPDLVFSPDGRKILAIEWGSPKYELWALENFEPKTSR